MSASLAMNARAVVYDGVYTLAGRMLRMLLALIMSILIARVLGPQGRGMYALATAVYAGLVLSTFTGISSSMSYFMLNAGAGRGVLRPALITGAMFCAAGAIPIAAMSLLSHNAWACVPSLLLLPCNVPVMIVLGYALGRKRIRWQTTYSVISTAVLLGGMALGFLLFSRSAWTAVTAYVAISGAIAAGALAFVLRDARGLEHRDIRVRQFALYAVRVGIVNFVTLLNYRADLYIVGLLASTAVLGQYAVAISAAESLLVVTQVAAVATSPHVGSMDRREAAQLTAHCVRATFAIALTICIVFFAIAPYVVHLLYGSAYLPMVPALRILLAGVMILSIGSALSNFFTLKLGKPEVALVSQLCAAVVCIVVSWVFVPRIGMVGAAAASALAYLLGALVQIGYFLKTSKISIAALLVPTAQDVKSVIAVVKQSADEARRTMAQFAATRL